MARPLGRAVARASVVRSPSARSAAVDFAEAAAERFLTALRSGRNDEDTGGASGGSMYRAPAPLAAVRSAASEACAAEFDEVLPRWEAKAVCVHSWMPRRAATGTSCCARSL